MMKNEMVLKKDQVWENVEKRVIIHTAGKIWVKFTIKTIVGWTRIDTLKVPRSEFEEMLRSGRFELV